MTLLWITHAGNPPKIAGDDLSSGSQLKGSTKKKAGTGSTKLLSPDLQPSVGQVKGKKATISPPNLSQPSSGTQLRALNRKKATGSVTSPPSESAPLNQPPSGTQVRAPNGKKVTGSATVSPSESTSVVQQPSGARDKRKKTILSRPPSGTQVRAPKGKKVTGSATISPSESTSVAQQARDKRKKTVLSQPPSGTQVRALEGKRVTGSATVSPFESTSVAQARDKRKKTVLSQSPPGTQVRAPEGKKVTESATISSSESNSVVQQPPEAQDKRKKTVLSRPPSGTQIRAPEEKKVTQTRGSKGSTVLGIAQLPAATGSAKNHPTSTKVAKGSPSATMFDNNEPLAMDEFSSPITFDDDTEYVLLSDPETIWIKKPFLTKSDKSCIENPHGWLNDAIIHAAQLLLKCQTQRERSGLGGFQNPLYAQGYRFQKEDGEFVQVLHVSDSHWITVSNIGCRSDSVYVFDSAYAFIDMDGKKQVCSLMKPTGDVLFMDFVNIQHQGNGSDCGLFALACATDLVYGRDPFLSYWNTKVMRPHLIKCLETKKMTCFPLDKTRRIPVRNKLKKSIKVNIHCICRMPYGRADQGMVCCDVCRKWFHCTCMKIEESVSLSDIHWECNQSMCKPKGRKSQR